MSGHGKLEENSETDEGFSFGAVFRRYRTPLTALATLLIFCLVGYAIMQLTDEVRYDDVVEALAETRLSSILLALFFTALSFMALVFYDLNAIEYIGKRLPFPHVALTAFSAYAVGNTAGFGALSGGAIRYRAYTRLGLSPEDIGRVIAFVTLSFGLGLAAVSAIALLIIADEIAPLISVSSLWLRIIAAVILAILGSSHGARPRGPGDRNRVDRTSPAGFAHLVASVPGDRLRYRSFRHGALRAPAADGDRLAGVPGGLCDCRRAWRAEPCAGGPRRF